MTDLSPGVAAPAYVFIPVQRAGASGDPLVSRGRHRRSARQRVTRAGGHWTVIEPRPSLLHCVARRLRATLSA